MNIVFKNKIKIDKNFINDLIAKSWQDSESIQNQIDCIEVDSAVAAKTVKLLKDLLTSYYVFTGCLENIENEPINVVDPEPRAIEPENTVDVPEESVNVDIADINTLSEFDTEITGEPFEYFVDFDEPTGEPLTDGDLYS